MSVNRPRFPFRVIVILEGISGSGSVEAWWWWRGTTLGGFSRQTVATQDMKRRWFKHAYTNARVQQWDARGHTYETWRIGDT